MYWSWSRGCCSVRKSLAIRFFLEISFNGSSFHGFQVQPGQGTVQGHLNKALSTLYGTPVETVGCGRTDAGVHAFRYMAHYDAPAGFKGDLAHKLNAILPESIAVDRLVKVKDEAHARFDAEARSYVYSFHFKKDPFVLGRSLHVTYSKLDWEKAHAVAAMFLGEHDFKAFSKHNPDNRTSICKILESTLEEQEGQISYYISANRFLHNMVRRLSGTLLQVARGQVSVEQVEKSLKTGKDLPKSLTLPAHGLCFTGAVYPYL